jgi:hypothetical protein
MFQVRVAVAIAVGAIAFSFSPVVRSQGAATPAVLLQQQKADAALAVFNSQMGLYAAGAASIDEIGVWGERLYQARKDSGMSGSAFVQATHEWEVKMRGLEALATQRLQAGTVRSAEVDKARFFRLEAQQAAASVHP